MNSRALDLRDQLVETQNELSQKIDFASLDAQFEQKIRESVLIREFVEDRVNRSVNEQRTAQELWFAQQMQARCAVLDQTVSTQFDRMGQELTRDVLTKVTQATHPPQIDPKFREEILLKIAAKEMELGLLQNELKNVQQNVSRLQTTPVGIPEIQKTDLRVEGLATAIEAQSRVLETTRGKIVPVAQIQAMIDGEIAKAQLKAVSGNSNPDGTLNMVEKMIQASEAKCDARIKFMEGRLDNAMQGIYERRLEK